MSAPRSGDVASAITGIIFATIADVISGAVTSVFSGEITGELMARRKPTTVGVLAEPFLLEWQVRSLEYALANADVDIPLVVVNDPAESAVDPETLARTVNKGPGLESLELVWRVLARERAWALVVAERELAKRFGEDRPLRNRRAVSDVSCFDDAEIRWVTPNTDGPWNELPTDAARAVGDRCDVVVRYGFGLLRGEILETPPNGVVSFHPANIRRYRGLGTPMAYVDGRKTIGVTLQRLTEEIDAGEIVVEADLEIAACSTLWDVYDRIHERQIELLAEGIDALRSPSFEPTVPDSLGPYYPRARRRTPRFAARTLLRNARGRLS